LERRPLKLGEQWEENHKVVGKGGKPLKLVVNQDLKVLFGDEAFDRKDMGGWSLQAVFQVIVCFKRWKSVSINHGD
jgi:hypothetical protein